MSKHQQADGEIHEDQLLNFLVNALTGSFGVRLGQNADLDPEDIYRGPRRRTRRRDLYLYALRSE